ncbi:MAG: hypothetical protein KF816_03360 [Melioribacteraceae bacterium]|nr:hypothetical protein [Melioribacteraceae bacterium]
MRDIVITKKQIKRELTIWLCCFGIAFIINFYAIFKYDTQWIELFTQFHVVLILSLFNFFVFGIIRIVLSFLMSLRKSRGK